jgi:UDP-N-acetylglucosamine acyltransferase
METKEPMFLSEEEFEKDFVQKSTYTMYIKEGISEKFTRDFAFDNFRQDASGNIIHKTATISHNVKLGVGNYIGAYCYLVDCKIGNGNRFEAFCSIGTPPEYKSHFAEGDWNEVEIGDENVIREFVTINAGTKRKTIIGNKNWLLKGSHIGHDAWVQNDCTLSCNSLIGGHSIIMDGVNMGLASVCHQFSILGAYSMYGMGAIVTKKLDAEPFKIFVGNPATYLKENSVAIERNNISQQQMQNYFNKYKLYKDGGL